MWLVRTRTGCSESQLGRDTVSEGRSSFGVGEEKRGGRGKPIPQERINTGSESFTIGKCRRFPAYTAWLPMLSSESNSGSRSTTASRICVATIP